MMKLSLINQAQLHHQSLSKPLLQKIGDLCMGANGLQRRYLHIKQLLEHVTDSGAAIFF
ncbi:hypothetical protein ACFORK_06435 [Paenibacillus sp. GCM10012306]